MKTNLKFWLTKFIVVGGLQLLPLSYLFAAEEMVFILSGQSNMQGLASVDEIPDSLAAVPSNVTYILDGEVTEFTSNGNLRFGPEVSFAHEISARWPDRNITLIKFAVGGASLLAWSPEWTEENANITSNSGAGNLYNKLMGYIAAQNIDPSGKYKAVLWMQGERDARFPEAGAMYLENFLNLIEHLRGDLGEPQLPVLFGQINPPSELYPALTVVRSAQSEVAEKMSGVEMVSTAGLSKLGDNLHYDAAGLIELGQRFAETFIEIYSED